MSAKLVRGELSARVPPRAHGFRVETHAGDFVDLGTEFGLLVGTNGDVETHVFKGKVLAPKADGVDSSSQTLLETGHAWARGPSGAVDTNIASAPGKFLLTLPEDSFASPALPPVDRSLSLWYSADNQVRLDADGGVSEWGDIAVRPNLRRENAWQVSAGKRPKLVTKSIGGKPALRFDGYKGLVTEPLKLGPSEASAIVFRIDGESSPRIDSRPQRISRAGRPAFEPQRPAAHGAASRRRFVARSASTLRVCSGACEPSGCRSCSNDQAAG